MNRSEIAHRQAALLEALLADGPVPDGFDGDQVAVERDALSTKRRRIIAALRPDVVDELGDRFPALCATFIAEHPKRSDTRARDDAQTFVQWLVRNRELRKPRRWMFKAGR